MTESVGDRPADVVAAGPTAQAALLLHEAQWELDHGLMTAKPDIADYFINKHLRPAYDPLDDDQYLKRLARLMAVV